MDYKSLIPDDKILNYCQYVQFKYNSNVLFITGDNTQVGNAITKKIYKVWNINNRNLQVSDFLSVEGLLN